MDRARLLHNDTDHESPRLREVQVGELEVCALSAAGASAPAAPRLRLVHPYGINDTTEGLAYTPIAAGDEIGVGAYTIGPFVDQGVRGETGDDRVVKLAVCLDLRWRLDDDGG